MRILNYAFVPLTTVTDPTTFNSNPINMEDVFGYAIQAVFAGTPTGTVKLQGSCDQGVVVNGSPTAPSNWTDISTTSTAIAGAPATILYNQSNQFYTWVRLNYTSSGGAGTLIARINTRGF